jgi:hypothetical protein
MEIGTSFTIAQPEPFIRRAFMRRSLVVILILGACAQPRVNAPPPRVDSPLDRQVGVSSNGVAIRNEAADGTHAAVVRAPIERVWAAVNAVYAEIGVPTTAVDSAGYQLGNGQFQFRRQLGGQPASRYFDCGLSITGPRADEGQIRAVIATRLTAAPDGTTLMSTTVHGAVQSSSGTTSSRMDCSSTGRLESRMESAVAQRVAAMQD